MAVRKILRLGDPRLRLKAEPVLQDVIMAKETKKLIRDMFDTMEAADGLGLAAPQIGVLKQIIVVGFEKDNKRYADLDFRMEAQVLINPQIEVLDTKSIGSWEGCLSVPDMRGYVERPCKIRLRWYNEKEEHNEEVIEGFRAVVYQHECDHLSGILYVERLKDMRLFGFSEELDQTAAKAAS